MAGNSSTPLPNAPTNYPVTGSPNQQLFLNNSSLVDVASLSSSVVGELSGMTGHLGLSLKTTHLATTTTVPALQSYQLYHPLPQPVTCSPVADGTRSKTAKPFKGSSVKQPHLTYKDPQLNIPSEAEEIEKLNLRNLVISEHMQHQQPYIFPDFSPTFGLQDPLSDRCADTISLMQNSCGIKLDGDSPLHPHGIPIIDPIAVSQALALQQQQLQQQLQNQVSQIPFVDSKLPSNDKLGKMGKMKSSNGKQLVPSSPCAQQQVQLLTPQQLAKFQLATENNRAMGSVPFESGMIALNSPTFPLNLAPTLNLPAPSAAFPRNLGMEDGLMVAAPARTLHETLGDIVAGPTTQLASNCQVLGHQTITQCVDTCLSPASSEVGIAMSSLPAAVSLPIAFHAATAPSVSVNSAEFISPQDHLRPVTPPHYPPVDLNSQTDSNHDTALTLACAGGHEELVNLLLSHGADIEHRDQKGFTPLMLSATAGHSGVAEILLNHGADIEAQSERTKDTALSLACSGGRYEVVEILLNRVANKEHRNVSDYTPLSLAASGGYVNIIKLLLSHGAEINSRTGSKLGISPLMLAAMNGHTAAVKLLLDMGSDINAQIETNRNTALTLACFQGRHEVVSLLLDRKATVEHRAKTGLTPLMEAASGGYVEVGRVLLDKGADVNAPPVPSSRDTALTIAADKGHYRFVELLLSRNASVDVKNKKGNSPLWLAANGGHLDVLQLLVNAGADIDSQDNRKISCLMAAFRRGHVKVVKWMVKHVNQFPSDQEMTRYIATVSDKELLKKCHQCMEVIKSAKDRQAAEANKYASILLEELDLEKSREESRRAAAARRRERKRRKKKERQEQIRAARVAAEEKKITGGSDSLKNGEPSSQSDGDDEDDDDDDEDDKDVLPNEIQRDPKIRSIPPPAPEELRTNKTLKLEAAVVAPIDPPQAPPPPVQRAEPTSGLKKSNLRKMERLEMRKDKRNAEKMLQKERKHVKETSFTKETNTSQQLAVDRSSKCRKQKAEESLVAVSCAVPSIATATFTSVVTNPTVAMPAAAASKVANSEIPRHQIFHTFSSKKASSRNSKLSSGSEKSREDKRNDFITTSNSSLQIESGGITGKNKSPISSILKKNQKREEGWKEVVRSKSDRSKKVSVPANAISRVIGRGGSNINAIREVSGAHIEVEKHKGQGDRTVIIRGSADATRQAHQLITTLIKEPDNEIRDVLAHSDLSKSESKDSITIRSSSKVSSSSSVNSSTCPIKYFSIKPMSSAKASVANSKSSMPLPSLPASAAPPFTVAVRAPSSVTNSLMYQGMPLSGISTMPFSLNSRTFKSEDPTSMKAVASGEDKFPFGHQNSGKRDSSPPGTSTSTKTTVSYTMAVIAPGKSTKTVPAVSVALTTKMSLSGDKESCGKENVSASQPPSIGSQVTSVLQQTSHMYTESSSKVPMGRSASAMMAFPKEIHITVASKVTNVETTTIMTNCVTHSIIPQDYSPFNNIFSKAQPSVWGQKDTSKPNFASVAAVGVTSVASSYQTSRSSPRSYSLSNSPNSDTDSLVTAAKAPGYRVPSSSNSGATANRQSAPGSFLSEKHGRPPTPSSKMHRSMDSLQNSEKYYEEEVQNHLPPGEMKCPQTSSNRQDNLYNCPQEQLGGNSQIQRMGNYSPVDTKQTEHYVSQAYAQRAMDHESMEGNGDASGGLPVIQSNLNPNAPDFSSRTSVLMAHQAQMNPPRIPNMSTHFVDNPQSNSLNNFRPTGNMNLPFPSVAGMMPPPPNQGLGHFLYSASFPSHMQNQQNSFNKIPPIIPPNSGMTHTSDGIHLIGFVGGYPSHRSQQKGPMHMQNSGEGMAGFGHQVDGTSVDKRSGNQQGQGDSQVGVNSRVENSVIAMMSPTSLQNAVGQSSNLSMEPSVNDEDKKLPRPIGTERAQKKLPMMGSVPEVANLWAFNSSEPKPNTDWLHSVHAGLLGPTAMDHSDSAPPLLSNNPNYMGDAACESVQMCQSAQYMAPPTSGSSIPNFMNGLPPHLLPAQMFSANNNTGSVTIIPSGLDMNTDMWNRANAKSAEMIPEQRMVWSSWNQHQT